MTKRVLVALVVVVMATVSVAAETRAQAVPSASLKARQQVARFKVWLHSMISPPWPVQDEPAANGRLSPPWPTP